MWAAGALRGAPASTTRTLRRARDRTRAADRPAAPPPMTTTSYLLHGPRLGRAAAITNERCCFWEYGSQMSLVDDTQRRPSPPRSTRSGPG